MLHRSLTTFGITGLGLCGLIAAPAIAAPSITIDGLAGAEHWTWVEGENATDGTGVVVGTSAASLSGSPGASYYAKDGSIGSDDFVEWEFTAPASMSAKLYLRASLERSRSLSFYLDGSEVAVATVHVQEQGEEYTWPTQFIGQSSVSSNPDPNAPGIGIGSIEAGDHELRIQKASLTLNGWRFDGVLFYDGTPVLPAAFDEIGGRSWLTNPSSAASPALTNPATAEIDVTGLGANDQVVYLLNDAAYVPGTEIGPGSYELEVYVLSTEGGTASRTAYSGANFTVIPEPASLGLVAAGMFAVLARPWRAASE